MGRLKKIWSYISSLFKRVHREEWRPQLIGGRAKCCYCKNEYQIWNFTDRPDEHVFQRYNPEKSALINIYVYLCSLCLDLHQKKEIIFVKAVRKELAYNYIWQKGETNIFEFKRLRSGRIT